MEDPEVKAACSEIMSKGSGSMTAKDLENYSVYELRMFLISKGVTVGSSKKTELLKLAQAAISVGLMENVDFHDDVFDLSDRLVINGYKVPDPFLISEIELTNRLVDLPPFGIEDIFNFLIFKSTQYDRQKIASYKAFEEYGLFEDGYVEDLKVTKFRDHFIFVGKVKPTMNPKTRTGAQFYRLWFIMNGTREASKQWSPTAGSIFSAYCMCPGGQDGACKHIAAAMYSLHDCLYPSEKAPTEELCYWKKRPTKTTNPLPITEIKIANASTLMKKHNFKSREKRSNTSKVDSKEFKKRTRGPYKDKITYDPRAPCDRKEFSKEKMSEIKSRLSEFGCLAGMFIESDSDDMDEVTRRDVTDKASIIYKKAKSFIENKGPTCEEFLNELDISPAERSSIEICTREQGQTWKQQRRGFVTSTRLKDLFTRQKAMDKDPRKSGSSLAARCLEMDGIAKYKKPPIQIEYGRIHESDARKEYKKLMSQTHANFMLKDSGLQISSCHHFIAASPDNLKSCKCCGDAVVEYKCPYKTKHLHPREAFLDKSIGGKMRDDGSYYLDAGHKYYFQIQCTMAVLHFTACDFVVYTQNTDLGCDGGIFIVQVPFSQEFWDDVRQAIQRFYLTWMLPAIFDDVQTNSIYTERKKKGANEIQEKKDSDSERETLPEDVNVIHSYVNVEDNEVSSSQFAMGEINGVPLFQDDIDSLSEGAWLTDNIIVLFSRVLKAREDFPADVIFLDSVFYLSLMNGLARGMTREEAFQRASSHFKELSSSGTVIIPICSHSHWYGIVFSKNCIVVMDSLSFQSGNVIRRDEQIDIISKFISWKFNICWENVERHVLRVPQQRNGTDCGVYLLLNLAHFVSAENFNVFLHDHETFGKKDYSCWYGENIA